MCVYTSTSFQLTEPSKIVKMPLPFRSKIIFTSDFEHVFCPAPDGRLDVFS